MISVVIINFNGVHLLANCIEAAKMHVPSLSEIILLDNGSNDGSVSLVESRFPTVRLVKSPTNLGFVGGNNEACEIASGKYLLLLNSDTIIQNSLQPMIDILEKNTSIWVVGCRLKYGNGELQESIGHQLGPARLALSWTPLVRYFPSLRQKESRHSKIYREALADCEYVSGACLMTPARKWRDLNGLDNNYFMYMEDVDYCVRVRRLGGRVVYTAESEVTHLEGAGRPWVGRRAVLNTAVSDTIYVRKFHGVLGRFVLGTVLAPILLLRAFGHRLMHAVGSDPHGKDKSLAYVHASLIVLIGPRAPNTRY